MTTPAELIRRGLLRGPLITMASSSPNQWAGRTTLSSGSATVTVSTFQVNSDSLITLGVEAALPAAYTTLGRTAIASGTISGTASTTAIYSGDVVQLTWESPNALTSGMALRVDSIVGGVSFAITAASSSAPVASGAVVMWRIEGKDFAGLKVNTISDSSYFTLGWSDGRARPRDCTIMWEIRKTR